jgi:hypothetical protein
MSLICLIVAAARFMQFHRSTPATFVENTQRARF